MCPENGSVKECHYLNGHKRTRADCGNVNLGMMGLAMKAKKRIKETWE